MTSASTPAQAPWRPIRAVTLDLWGTLIDSRDPIGKIERRREMLLTPIRGAGHPIELEQLRAGFRAARRIIDDGIARDRRDVGPPGRWEELMRQLSIPPETVPFDLVTAAYEELTLEYLPNLLDGVEAAVQQLASKYQIALICNTGYTGGRVLRQVLARHGLIGYFEELTFSNEHGWLKPDPRIFLHTLAELASHPRTRCTSAIPRTWTSPGRKRPGCTRRATCPKATTTAPSAPRPTCTSSTGQSSTLSWTPASAPPTEPVGALTPLLSCATARAGWVPTPRTGGERALFGATYT